LIPQGGDLPGTDNIEEVNTVTTIWKDAEGTETARLTTTTSTSATVNADGEVSEVSQRSLSTVETGGKISEFSDHKKMDVKDAGESFKNTAQYVSDFKKENGRSPVQQEAKDNKQLNKNISAGAGAVGMFASSVAKWAPSSQTKGAAAIVNGASLLTIAVTNTVVPTNPENIKLKITTIK